jgi:hypothetical protein
VVLERVGSNDISGIVTVLAAPVEVTFLAIILQKIINIPRKYRVFNMMTDTGKRSDFMKNTIAYNDAIDKIDYLIHKQKSENLKERIEIKATLIGIAYSYRPFWLKILQDDKSIIKNQKNATFDFTPNPL